MVGYQLAAANLGVASIPWALGLLAEAYGLAVLGPGLLGVTVTLAILNLWADRPRAGGSQEQARELE
jgi:fucose permease